MLHPDIEEIVVRVSNTFANAKRFGMDPEDFAQELRLWCWQNMTKVEHWFDDPKRGRGYLTTTLRNKCKDLYSAEREAREGRRDPDEQWRYSRKMIEALLPSMFKEEEWIDGPPKEDADLDTGRRATIDPSQGGDWLAMLIDCKKAYDSLPHEDQETLKVFYLYGQSNKDVAEKRGWTSAKVSNWRIACIRKMQEFLGEKERQEQNPWVGRRAMSNARARYETGSCWDGDDISQWVGQ